MSVFSVSGSQVSLIEWTNIPYNDVCICDQLLYGLGVPHVHEHRHRIIVRRRQTLSVGQNVTR